MAKAHTHLTRRGGHEPGKLTTLAGSRPAAGIWPALGCPERGQRVHGATPYGRRGAGRVRVKRPYLLIWDGPGDGALGPVTRRRTTIVLGPSFLTRDKWDVHSCHPPPLPLFLVPSALCAEPEHTILVAQRFSQPWPQSRTVACCWRSITQGPLAGEDGLVVKRMSGVDGRLDGRAVRDAPRLTLQLSSSTLPLRASSHVGNSHIPRSPQREDDRVAKDRRLPSA